MLYESAPPQANLGALAAQQAAHIQSQIEMGVHSRLQRLCETASSIVIQSAKSADRISGSSPTKDGPPATGSDSIIGCLCRLENVMADIGAQMDRISSAL